jgi:hypothetical protein
MVDCDVWIWIRLIRSCLICLVSFCLIVAFDFIFVVGLFYS